MTRSPFLPAWRSRSMSSSMKLPGPPPSRAGPLDASLVAEVMEPWILAEREGTGRRETSLRGGHADRARDTGAAHPAIAVGVLREVLLMVILRVVELRRDGDLGRDGTVPCSGEPLLVLDARRLRGLLLERPIRVDGRAVLRSDVAALPHPLR